MWMSLISLLRNLGKDREQVTTIDRETIARLIFPHNAGDKFAAGHFRHQSNLPEFWPPFDARIGLAAPAAAHPNGAQTQSES